MKKLIVLLVLIGANTISNAQDIARTLNPSQLKEELSVLKEVLETLHPGLYKYNTKQEIGNLFTDLNSKVAKPLNEKDYYLLLAKFTEKIGCGHTYLNPLNLEDSITALYMPTKVLPFCFVVIDRKFIITHNLSSDTNLIKGTEITKINGFNTTQIVDSLLQVSRADGKNAIGKKLTNLELVPEQVSKYNLTDIFLPLFFKSMKEDFVIETKSIHNKIAISKIAGISTVERGIRYQKKFGIIPKGESLLKVQMLNDSTCYFKIGSFGFFGEQNPFIKKCDSLFLSLANNEKVKNLVIDIRSTEGGSTDLRNYLLKYILQKDFVANDYQERVFHSFLEVPKKLIPYLYTWNSSFFDPKPDSIYKMNEFGFYEDRIKNNAADKNIEDIKVSSNSFKGNIFLMTSPVNSSVAFEVARIFQQNKVGKIVGEKTGGSKQGINGGRSFFLTLPYSRIEIDVPIMYQAHIGQPDEGIFPDFNVTATQQGIYNGQDTQLEFVLKLIERKR